MSCKITVLENVGPCFKSRYHILTGNEGVRYTYSIYNMSKNGDKSKNSEMRIK